VHADVGKEDEIIQLLEKCAGDGRLDILVNNAAPRRHAPSQYVQKAAEWDEEISTMMSGPMMLTRAAIPYLTNAEGVVINVSSALARSIAHQSCGSRV